jgi:uncharacterized repeat protein (TIGR01451 family)
MNALIKYLFLLIAITLMSSEITLSQTVYNLPFASSGNRVELTVTNSSTITAKNVIVAVDSLPGWITMKQASVSAGDMASKSEKVVTFTFDADKKAPAGTNGIIKFKIISQSGEQWNKEIKVTAGAPDKFELYQNYPNPFNPSTIISYQLPYDSRVTIKIYNILGKEVITLFNGFQTAGYYENRFSTEGINGRALSSGMNIYRLTAKSSDGKSKEFSSIKKMMVLK